VLDDEKEKLARLFLSKNCKISDIIVLVVKLVRLSSNSGVSVDSFPFRLSSDGQQIGGTRQILQLITGNHHFYFSTFTFSFSRVGH